MCRRVQRQVRPARRGGDRLRGQRPIVADDAVFAIHDHLGRVDAVRAEDAGVVLLPLGERRGRERILPSEIVEVVDVQADRDHFDAVDGLIPEQGLQQRVSARAARTALRGEELHQHRHPRRRGARTRRRQNHDQYRRKTHDH